MTFYMHCLNRWLDGEEEEGRGSYIRLNYLNNPFSVIMCMDTYCRHTVKLLTMAFLYDEGKVALFLL